VQDVTRARNHVVRRYAGRFVDHEHAIHRKHFLAQRRKGAKGDY
jgi:hypothetical protein